MPTTPPHPILTQHFNNSRTALAKIDEEVAALRESIRALLAFRNTFTPAYRLPPEVLTHIFSYIQQATLHFYDPSSRNKAPRCLRASQVSQHWRNVALGSPGLWSCIYNTYPKCILEMWLERSKCAPLSVELLLTSSSDVSFVSSSLFRTRSLTVRHRESTPWNADLPDLAFPAPLLESLVLDADHRWSSRSVSVIPDNIFAGIVPALRHLEVAGCAVNPNSCIFADLTSLILKNSNLSGELTSTDLLGILRRLPRLISLVLSGVLRSDSLAPLNVEKIALSSLQSLSISGSALDQDLGILSNLSFPATATLDFHSFTRSGDVVTALSDFLSANKAARQPSLDDILVDRIHLEHFHTTISLHMNVGCKEPGHITDLMKFQLGGPWHHTLELPDTPEAETIISYLPLDALRSFETNFVLGVGIWTNAFRRATVLKEVAVVGYRAESILEAIVDDFKPEDQLWTNRRIRRLQGERERRERVVAAGVRKKGRRKRPGLSLSYGIRSYQA
ncbi:hypothetical protein BDN72DRAFT_847612 [Pluteus cervinus]|uniref:Uncharacterized protein n=1 Tax=Pluteus cervinus TaxID=181527 RepID=A0ACD3AD46_9AGAR|nr:hypothetical protein BDN72DRAFT_847612 [Pluteus cervinus]